MSNQSGAPHCLTSCMGDPGFVNAFDCKINVVLFLIGILFRIACLGRPESRSSLENPERNISKKSSRCFAGIRKGARRTLEPACCNFVA